MPITIDDVHKAKFLQDAHYNGGPKFYGYGYRCVEFPRLRFIDRTSKMRADRGRTTRTFYVDGQEVENLAFAVAALNISPALTDDERAMLERIPRVPTALRALEDDLAGGPNASGHIIRSGSPHSRVMDTLRRLLDKGVIAHPKIFDGERNQPGIVRCDPIPAPGQGAPSTETKDGNSDSQSKPTGGA